jgi:hypothetical protein
LGQTRTSARSIACSALPQIVLQKSSAAGEPTFKRPLKRSMFPDAGDQSTWTDSTGGLPIRFKKASLAETGDQLTFARILLRRHFRVLQHNPPMNGHRQAAAAGPKSADIVAKVENRTTRKISRKSIFRRVGCRRAPWRQCEGRWSFWYETMWSLMSPRLMRISSL